MHKISYGDEIIRYQVCYTPSKRNKVAIHVHPNGSVQVDAPQGSEIRDINQAVLKRARWIMNHVLQAKVQRESILLREYVSGESHFYLGRRYSLKVVPVSKKEGNKVKLLRGLFKIYTKDTSPQKVKNLLWQWYRAHAETYLSQRLEVATANISWVNTLPEWRLLTMKKQWGSCSPKGILSLNPHLIKAPRECIEYVLYHELCHLHEHNHSKRFYNLLSELMPEWKSVKTKLDGMAEVLLNE